MQVYVVGCCGNVSDFVSYKSETKIFFMTYINVFPFAFILMLWSL